MKFEEWGEETLEYRPTKGAVRQMYADWKAEREDLLHANEVLGKENVRVINRREKLIGVLEDLSEWGQVAFYPGPNEDPSFQSGYMTAVHDAERQINRKLAEVKEKV